MGGILGGVAVWSIHGGRLRNPLIAGAVSLLGALFMTGVMHYADYGRFERARAEAQPDFREIQRAPAEEREAFLKDEEQAGGEVEFLRQKNRREAEEFLQMIDVRGFGSYLAWEAGQGIRISSSRGGSSDKGMPIHRHRRLHLLARRGRAGRGGGVRDGVVDVAPAVLDAGGGVDGAARAGRPGPVEAGVGRGGVERGRLVEAAARPTRGRAAGR